MIKVENRILGIDSDQVKAEKSSRQLKSWKSKLLILTESSDNSKNIAKLTKYNLLLISEINDRINYLSLKNKIIRWFKRRF